MRSSEHLTVPIQLARTSAVPLHEQLVDALRAAIDSGVLPAGSRLPSTRTLAEVLGVSRGVAVAAYERLFASGAIQGSCGSGTYVSDTAPPTTTGAGRAEPAIVDLRPGQVCTEGFPLAAWRSAWRQASYDPPPPGAAPGNGLPELRTAVADHVRRIHGHAPAEHQIVITSGPRHALDVLLWTFGALGPRCAMADPGPRWLREAVAARGVPAVPVPLDAEGIRADRLPGGVGAVLVAPDGDVSTGVRMSAERREQLADWSQRCGAWLIEIGRDATTDPRTPPLPSLIAIGPPHRTALVGDLGPLLTPALGLGYLVLPERLADAAAGRLESIREQPPLLCQRAATELFRQDIVGRRRTQLAHIHARKIAIVHSVLGPVARVEQPALPGTATVLLPGNAPAEPLAARCRERGLLLTPLHESYLLPRSAPDGVVLGFGQLADAVLHSALHTLADQVRCKV